MNEQFLGQLTICSIFLFFTQMFTKFHLISYISFFFFSQFPHSIPFFFFYSYKIALLQLKAVSQIRAIVAVVTSAVRNIAVVIIAGIISLILTVDVNRKLSSPR